jgi:sucrose-6-phosphate hydrolase SacC (GH32 family)
MDEIHRPQLHFTCRAGWLCDVNGPIHHAGEYHLFYEYNPAAPTWTYTNMHWGHAVSTDLLHWREMPPMLAPDHGGPINSGSVAVDRYNTSGLATGSEPVLVALYTEGRYLLPDNRPAAQSLAYSNDRGRTWTRYAGNPVLGATTHYARDPKILWHAASGRWIMALILSEHGDERDHTFGLFSSPNLRNWQLQSTLEMPTACDCPDLFALPLDGDPDDLRWVFWGGDGTHAIGAFDGGSFTVLGGLVPPLVPYDQNGASGFAAKVFGGVPADDGRAIQIAWLRNGAYPGMPFSQQLTFPCELSLRTGAGTGRVAQLCRQPVREIESLYRRRHRWRNATLAPGDDPLAAVAGELFDIMVELQPGTARRVAFTVHGHTVAYDTHARRLFCMDREVELSTDPGNGSITLRMLVDRNSIEIFADAGATTLACSFLPHIGKTGLRLTAAGGTARIVSLNVCELASIHA